MFGRDDSARPAARVRSYFPEALYINPEIITDGNGLASISIPLADSITTWRMAMVASTARGALGSGASSIKVFQDFFVDLDLPVTLTRATRSPSRWPSTTTRARRGDVSLKFSRTIGSRWRATSPEKTLAVDAGRVGVVAVHHRGQPHREVQADARMRA